MLAEESTSVLTELGATLDDRIKDLEQQNQELQECNQELEKEKDRYAKKAKELEISLEEKREQLWGEIADLQDAHKLKNEELQKALDSRAEHRQAETVLREELGSLRQHLRAQNESLLQAKTQSSEKVSEANAREAQLKETVKQLEKRLKDQNKLIRDQQVSFSQVTAQSNERAREAKLKQTLLKESVEQLEKRLEEQRKTFEEERVQLQQQVGISQNDTQTELTSSLERAMPQLRNLLNAFDRVRIDEKCRPASTGKSRSAKVLGQSSDLDLMQRLREQESAFDRERAQLLEQASDAAETQRTITRRNLMEREGFLTCPITLELFEFPVVTGCCGKTFSSEGLRQAIRQNPLCPFCRERLSSTHPNRDVAELIELHRRERSVLGMPDTEPSSFVVSTSQPNENVVAPAASTGRAHNSRRSTSGSSTRQSRHREHRSERVQARSEVPHHRSSTLRTAQVNGTTPIGSTRSYSNTAVVTTASETQRQDTPITPGGLYISRVGSDGTATRAPPHMVRSVLASLRFPSAKSQSTARLAVDCGCASGRRQRSGSRTASSALSPASSTTVSAPRRRSAKSSAASRAVLSAVPNTMATTVASAVPSATRTSTSLSKRRVHSSTSAVLNTPVSGVPSSAASMGAMLAAMPFPPPSAVPIASSSATSVRGSQVSSFSGNAAANPNSSLNANIKAWAPAHPSRIAATRTPASSSALVDVSSTATAAAPTATTTTSRRPVQISASQDDSALTRQRHVSPRLALSQPAPREPLRNLAQSITSLKDLLGSDFNSDSDSV